MLSDVKFRRTAGCRMFESTVFTMKLNKFPIQEVDCENMDIDELMIKSEFNMPFVVKGISDKLGIKVLPRQQTLTDVANIIGRSFPIKMIEVAEQSEIEGKLGEYADYLKGYTPLHKIINMISLEFSTTELSKQIQAPQFVRDIDWIDTVWPMERKLINDYPKVQKYCLSGMASSYTDFHIDFGGTSVWYHVVNGKKRFYLIAPTLRNLQLFKTWSVSSTQADTFFGDIVGRSECFEYDLNPGDTFMIPSGWIHAVYTPEDSLVFGGNFLHKNAILRQMQVYQIEGSTRVGKKYRFPLFRQINWYTLCMVLPLALAKFCPQLANMSLDELDTSDYDPEVVKMGENLNTSHLFHQFLFLVRICDEWVALLKDQEEIQKFLEIAKEYAEIEVMYEVIQKWWAVLESVATLLDADTGTSCDSDSSNISEGRQSNLEYLQYVRHLEGQVNLLDERVVSRALSTFDNQVKSLYASINYTPSKPTSASAVASVAATAGTAVSAPPEERLSLTLKLRPKATPVKSSNEESSCSSEKPLDKLPGENPFASDTSSSSSYQETLPSTVIDSEYSGPGTSGRKVNLKLSSADEQSEPYQHQPPADLTSLKFKLPRSSAGAGGAGASGSGSHRPTPVKSEPTAAAGKEDKSSLLSFNLDPLHSSPLMMPTQFAEAVAAIPDIGVEAATSFGHGPPASIPKPIGREEALKLKRIQEKNKAREILTADTGTSSSAAAAATTKPTRFKITMTASKPVAPRVTNTVGVKTESEGQRKYGTRGLKLSNAFLQNAMDVDFTEVESGSLSKEAQQQRGQQQETKKLANEEEQQEEEEFHFVDAESRMKGGDEYSEDSAGEEDEADDLVEYDTADDDSDLREYSGRAAYAGTTTGEEEDAAYSEGDSDDERVVRRRTNKRTQADRGVANEASTGKRPGASASSAAASAGVKRRRLSAAEREEEQRQQKKPFVVDRVSYNSYMGIPQNQPVMHAGAGTSSAPVASSFPQAKPVVKPKGGRSAIMKKLGIHR